MARALRVDRAKMIHHVLSRGNERQDIFYDEKDKKKFTELLGVIQEKYGVIVWSYVLMDNHYHLLLKMTLPNLSKVMQWLGLTYSGWFNARHSRSGHLFQGRFKNFVIQEEEYLCRLILYIHRNPLRAKMVKKIHEYSWSSYRKLGGYSSCPDWLRSENVLKRYDGKSALFRKAIIEYKEESDGLLNSLRCGILLGSQEAMRRIKNQIGKYVNREKPQTRAIKQQELLEEVIQEIAVTLGILKKELETYRYPIRGYKRQMRDILIYLLWQKTYYTLNALGKYFKIGYTSVASARKRGEIYFRKNPKLRRRINAHN